MPEMNPSAGKDADFHSMRVPELLLEECRRACFFAVISRDGNLAQVRG